MTITEAWRKLIVLLDGEPFRITDTIMHGGTAGYPVQWVEIDYKGNIYSAETFDDAIEMIKKKEKL